MSPFEYRKFLSEADAKFVVGAAFMNPNTIWTREHASAIRELDKRHKNACGHRLRSTSILTTPTQVPTTDSLDHVSPFEYRKFLSEADGKFVVGAAFMNPKTILTREHPSAIRELDKKHKNACGPRLRSTRNPTMP